MTQLPTPVAMAPLAKAKLREKSAAARDCRRSLNIGTRPLFPESRPCGRNLMNTMASTKTSTSATTGAMTHGSAALSVPITPAPATGPSNEPTPPSMTARKPWIRKRTPRSANSENTGTISAPGKPGERGAEREGGAVDRVGRNARGARQRRIFQRRAHPQAEAGARQQQIAADHHQRGDHDDDAAPASRTAWRRYRTSRRAAPAPTDTGRRSGRGRSRG